MKSIVNKFYIYLDCIEKILIRIDKDVNNILSSNWFSYHNEYSDIEFEILEEVSNDLCLLSFQNIILNLCNLYKNNTESISLHKIIDYIEVNYRYLNLDKNVALTFCYNQKNILNKIESKRIYHDIFKIRDCQIAHIDKKVVAYFSGYMEENMYSISIRSLIDNLLNPTKKIVKSIFALIGIEKSFKRKNDNRFAVMYKGIIKF